MQTLREEDYEERLEDTVAQIVGQEMVVCIQGRFKSASITFVGRQGYLKTTNGESFIAVYEVVTEVVQPQAHVIDIESSAAGTNQTGGQSQRLENITYAGRHTLFLFLFVLQSSSCIYQIIIMNPNMINVSKSRYLDIKADISSLDSKEFLSKSRRGQYNIPKMYF